MNKERLTYLKDLTLALTVKELKSKYKSTTLGFLWILINPLLQMVVLTIVFSFFLKIDVKNYPVFVFSGLLPWTFFSLGLQNATSSLISNRELIKKVAFPRELLPISSVIAHLFTFSLALLLLVFFSSMTAGLSFLLLFLIPTIILETILIISLALLLSSLDIYYRDVSFALQALLIVWFYITPILYPINIVPQDYRLWYDFNPMVGIITTYQSIFLRENFTDIKAIIISTIITTLVLVVGVIVFNKRSKYFADWA